MNVEIENGQIVGYTQISKWSKDHNVSAYSLVILWEYFSIIIFNVLLYR